MRISISFVVNNAACSLIFHSPEGDGSYLEVSITLPFFSSLFTFTALILVNFFDDEPPCPDYSKNNRVFFLSERSTDACDSDNMGGGKYRNLAEGGGGYAFVVVIQGCDF